MLLRWHGGGSTSDSGTPEASLAAANDCDVSIPAASLLHLWAHGFLYPMSLVLSPFSFVRFAAGALRPRSGYKRPGQWRGRRGKETGGQKVDSRIAACPRE